MGNASAEAQFFGSEKIWKILLKIAPPVMLAQLIQALYNIVDSLFVGRYAESGLTALSIVYPIQLLMVALAIGTESVSGGMPRSLQGSARPWRVFCGSFLPLLPGSSCRRMPGCPRPRRR